MPPRGAGDEVFAPIEDRLGDHGSARSAVLVVNETSEPTVRRIDELVAIGNQGAGGRATARVRVRSLPLIGHDPGVDRLVRSLAKTPCSEWVRQPAGDRRRASVPLDGVPKDKRRRRRRMYYLLSSTFSWPYLWR